MRIVEAWRLCLILLLSVIVLCGFEALSHSIIQGPQLREVELP
jgi:hypothetical protein